MKYVPLIISLQLLGFTLPLLKLQLHANITFTCILYPQCIYMIHIMCTSLMAMASKRVQQLPGGTTAIWRPQQKRFALICFLDMHHFRDLLVVVVVDVVVE